MINTAAKITRTFLWTQTVKPWHLFLHIKLLIFSKDLKPDHQLTGKFSSSSITSDTLSVIVLITMFVIVSCQAILSDRGSHKDSTVTFFIANFFTISSITIILIMFIRQASQSQLSHEDYNTTWHGSTNLTTSLHQR